MIISICLPTRARIESTELWETHLEDMKGFILHHPPIILELPHYELQVLPALHISTHALVETPIQQYLPQQFDTLSLCHITLALDQRLVIPRKEHVEIRINVLCHETLVFCQNQSKTIECVGGDFEAGLIDPCEEFPKCALSACGVGDVDVGVDVEDCAVGTRFVVENYGCDGVVFQCFFEDSAAGAGAFAAGVAVAEGDDDFGLFADYFAQGVGFGVVVWRGYVAGLAEAEDVGDDGLGVFTGFEGQAWDRGDEDGEELFGEGGHDELVDLVG